MQQASNAKKTKQHTETFRRTDGQTNRETGIRQSGQIQTKGEESRHNAIERREFVMWEAAQPMTSCLSDCTPLRETLQPSQLRREYLALGVQPCMESDDYFLQQDIAIRCASRFAFRIRTQTTEHRFNASEGFRASKQICLFK